MPLPSSFRGTSFGTVYTVAFPKDAEFGAEAELTLQARERDFPIRLSGRQSARVLPATITPGSTAPSDKREWSDNVRALFRADGELYPLRASWRSITAELMCAVTSLKHRGGTTLNADHGGIWDAVLTAPDPIWRDVTVNNDSATPLTAGGTAPALPVITLTPSGTTVRRRRITIADNAGYGAKAYPVLASFDGSGVSANAATNYILFLNGRSIPFRADSPGSNPTRVLFDADVEPGTTAEAHLYYGSSVNNTITAGAWNPGGIDPATFSNTNWTWNEFNILQHARNASGRWFPYKIGGHTVAPGTPAFGWVQLTESSDGLSVVLTGRIESSPTDTIYDAIAMFTGGTARAGATNALTNLRRQLSAAGVGSGNVRVLYLRAGDLQWREAVNTAYSASTQDITAAVDLDDAIVIAVQLLVQGTSGSVRTLTISKAGAGDFGLALTGNPTVTVDAAVTARLITGALVNTTTGDRVTFNTVYTDDVALTIDCLGGDQRRRSVSVASGPLHGELVFSNEAQWMPLAVGSNAWTNPTGAAAAFAWRDGYY
jgi:hypothetical protein